MKYRRIENKNAAGGAMYILTPPVTLPNGQGLTTIAVGYLNGQTVEEYISAKIAETQKEIDACNAELQAKLEAGVQGHEYWTLDGTLYRLWPNGETQAVLGEGGRENEARAQYDKWASEQEKKRPIWDIGEGRNSSTRRGF